MSILNNEKLITDMRSFKTRESSEIKTQLNGLLQNVYNIAKQEIGTETVELRTMVERFKNPLESLSYLAQNNTEIGTAITNSMNKYFPATSKKAEIFKRTFAVSTGAAKECNISPTVMMSDMCQAQLWNGLLTPEEVDFCPTAEYTRNFVLKNNARALVTPCGVTPPNATLVTGKVIVSPEKLSLQYLNLCNDCSLTIDKIFYTLQQWIQNVNDTYNDIVKAQFLTQPAMVIPTPVVGKYIENLIAMKQIIIGSTDAFTGNINFFVSRRMYDKIITQKDDNQNFMFRDLQSCDGGCNSFCFNGMNIIETSYDGMDVNPTQDYIFAGNPKAGVFYHSPITNMQTDEKDLTTLGVTTLVGHIHGDAVIIPAYQVNFGYIIVTV